MDMEAIILLSASLLSSPPFPFTKPDTSQVETSRLGSLKKIRKRKQTKKTNPHAHTAVSDYFP